jgi:hypothetical protein
MISNVRNTLFVALAALVLTTAFASNASAQGPVATPPYAISVFAAGNTVNFQPDSIAVDKSNAHIFIGFGDGVAKDGSDGKSSTILEYNTSGVLLKTLSVKGHNDGLRFDPSTGLLWSLQNEDANPNLVIIDTQTGVQTVYTFGPTVHGGGFDDITFTKNGTFFCASNPTLNGGGTNPFGVLGLATLSGTSVNITPFAPGNSTATNIPTGLPVTLNVTDPDSMILDQRGNLMLTDQADAELLFIRQPGTSSQSISLLPLLSGGVSTQIDDTAIATHSTDFLLVSDITANAIYKITYAGLGFEPGVVYAAENVGGAVAQLDIDNGVLTPIVTGMSSARGLAFVKGK